MGAHCDVPEQPIFDPVPTGLYRIRTVRSAPPRRTGRVPKRSTMTWESESDIGWGEGPIPSASHDVWSHRDEGIGRRLLARKNRNKKKKDELRTSEDSSSDDDPFVRDRTCARRPAAGRCCPGGLRNGGRMRGDSAHCEVEVRCVKIAPHVKDHGCSCQVPQRNLWRSSPEDPSGRKRFCPSEISTI